jgi:hypothetical protein
MRPRLKPLRQIRYWHTYAETELYSCASPSSTISIRTLRPFSTIQLIKFRARVRVRMGSGSSRCPRGTGASAQALREANAEFMHVADGSSKHHRPRPDVKSSLPPQNVMRRLCCFSKRGSNAEVRFANRHPSAYMLAPARRMTISNTIFPRRHVSNPDLIRFEPFRCYY